MENSKEISQKIKTVTIMTQQFHSWAYIQTKLILKDTAALFTIVKTCKQPKCPSTEEWIKKMWYIYTIEYYSAIKKNEIMPSAATWMNPEIVILSELKSDREGEISYGIPYMWNLQGNEKNELT